MKQLIIFLLLIIACIIGYGQYKEFKRFIFTEYTYKVSERIDLNYHDQSILQDYYEAIEILNGFVIEQWSVNGIDVRTPKKDNQLTQYKTLQYAKKMAKVKSIEVILEQSKNLKNKSFNNEDIVIFETEGITLSELQQQEEARKHAILIKESFLKRNLVIGDKSTFIFEIQKLLLKKGYDIPIDGIYKAKTIDALKHFEAKHNLFEDGQVDIIVLDYLLQ